MIKAIIFDLDGTLIDSNRIHLAIFKKILKGFFGIKVKDSEAFSLFGRSAEEITEKLLSKKGKKFNQETIESFVKLNVELYNEKVKKMHLMRKSIFAFLKRLKEKGLKLAIVSGTERKMLYSSLKLQEIKLFNVLVTANDVKFAKPHPEIFKLALKKLGLKASECLSVGDGLLDLEASKKAKIPFAAVLSGIVSRKEFEKEKPFAIVKKIEELDCKDLLY